MDIRQKIKNALNESDGLYPYDKVIENSEFQKDLTLALEAFSQNSHTKLESIWPAAAGKKAAIHIYIKTPKSKKKRSDNIIGRDARAHADVVELLQCILLPKHNYLIETVGTSQRPQIFLDINNILTIQFK